MPLDILDLMTGPLNGFDIKDPEWPYVRTKREYQFPSCFFCVFCAATPDEAYCDHPESRAIDLENRRSIAFMRDEAGRCGPTAELYKGPY
jgi:hypothetical protein